MNREIFPGGVYPLQGDIKSTPGSSNVQVIGIQGIPIEVVTFAGGEVLEFNPNLNQWAPTLRAGIQVNNVTMSDDYLITVNVPKMVKINGS